MCAVDPAAVAHAGDRPCPTLDRMLRLARLSPQQAVAVAGPAALPVLIGLCRKGFERVACAAKASCAGESGASDALILTGPCAGDTLADLLGRTARLLGPKGVVVAHETTLDADPELEQALAGLGFEVEWTVHDLSGPCLVAYGVHRRVARAAPLATEQAWSALSRAFAR